jgi:hypothetical protein
MQRVHVLSNPSLACLESSPSSSFSGKDLSPSPAGFESESESRCVWLESESESQEVKISQVLYKASSTIP